MMSQLIALLSAATGLPPDVAASLTGGAAGIGSLAISLLTSWLAARAGKATWRALFPAPSELCAAALAALEKPVDDWVSLDLEGVLAHELRAGGATFNFDHAMRLLTVTAATGEWVLPHLAGRDRKRLQKAACERVRRHEAELKEAGRLAALAALRRERTWKDATKACAVPATQLNVPQNFNCCTPVFDALYDFSPKEKPRERGTGEGVR